MKSKAEHASFLIAERFLYVFLWYNLEIQQLQGEEL